MSTFKVAEYPIPTICIYCGAPVVYASNATIYGREYGNGKCYKCTSCDAYVGIHNGTCIPKGRLANRELRELKKKCHAVFDAVWQIKKAISRTVAYNRLASRLGIAGSQCHFGWFDKPMLLKCLEIMKDPAWYQNSNQEGMGYAANL